MKKNACAYLESSRAAGQEAAPMSVAGVPFRRVSVHNRYFCDMRDVAQAGALCGAYHKKQERDRVLG